MQYTDRYGDTYRLWFRKFEDGWTVESSGIEAMCLTEPYAEVCTTPPEHASAKRFPKPNPFCYWAKPTRLVEQMVANGLLRYTGRTTEYLNYEMCEVMPDGDWLDSLKTVTY